MSEINTTSIMDLPTDPMNGGSMGGSVGGNVHISTSEIQNSTNNTNNTNNKSLSLDQST